MDTQKFPERKTYISPIIECIELDNEISLELQSDAPVGPFELVEYNTPDFISNDPYRSLNT